MTTTEPGPILRAMIQAAGHEVEPLTDREIVQGALEHEVAQIGADIALDMHRAVFESPTDSNHAEHLVMHEKTYARLRAAAGLERKQHEERVPISRFSFWWQSVLLRIFRWAADELARHLRAEGHDDWTFTEARDDAGILPDRIVTVFDETEEEYIARLKKRALEGPQGAGIPIYASKYVPPGTAYAFNPKALEFDPMQASPITFEHDDTPFVQSDAFQSAMRDIRSAVAGGPFPARPHDQLLQPTSYAGIRVDADEEPHAAP